MPKLTLSRLKTLSRKTQMLLAVALLLSLGAGTALAMQGGSQPRSVSEAKQTAKTQKTGTVQDINTDMASAETPAADTSESSAASSSTQQQTDDNQSAATGTTQNSTVPPASTPDPCDKAVIGPVITQADTNISFVESVTIPVGCTVGPFTVKTTDNRSVLFHGFTNKPTSPVKGVMGFTGTTTSSSAAYTVVITDAATPGYYEDFAFVEDSSLSFGGFAVTVKITVIPR